MTWSAMNTDRSKHRMERLRQIELEQQQWEQDALVMPEAWNQLLLLSFRSVKTEFSDLDGLLPQARVHEAPTPKATCSDLGESPRPSSPHTIYTSRSEQGSFAYNNTIRASRPPPRPPLYCGVARYQSQDCSARQSPSFRTH